MDTRSICCINRPQSQIEFEHQLYMERNQWINSSWVASSTTESNLSYFNKWSWPAIQLISVTQLCLTLWDLMDYSMPGFPVHHQLSELTQTHVHWAGDAIQPSPPLSSPSPPTFSLSQHRGLFQWVTSLHQVTKVFECQLQHQSFQWRISLQSKGLWRVFPNTTVQKHQFFGTQLSLQSKSHIHTWRVEKPQPWLDRP